MDELVSSLAYPWNGASQHGKGSEIKRLCSLCRTSAEELASSWGASPTAEQGLVLASMRDPLVGAAQDDDHEIQRLYDLCRRAARLAGAPS